MQATWRDLPDHIAAIGEAIALLAGKNPHLARRLAREFLKPWLDRFGPQVKTHDPTGFYATLVDLLQEAIHAKTGVS